MTPQDLLLEVFCLVDDELKTLNLGRLRARGPLPSLADSEVIAIEVVGEFFKVDADRDLFRHFRQHYAREFPALACIHRTPFARQAANLGHVKQLIQQRLAQRLAGADSVWLVDSLPIPACQFARATYCRRFRGEADYGYDHLLKRTFYGFRLHLRTSRDGVILACALAPARASDKAVLPELQPPAGSIGIGDRNYWDPELQRQLAEAGVVLLAPYRHKSKDPDPAWSSKLSAVRYRLETVNGQLAERYTIKRTWAKDLWHLCHRVLRKILSHTTLVWLTVQARVAPLSFDRLLAV
jgi:Transposase DDE domain